MFLKLWKCPQKQTYMFFMSVPTNLGGTLSVKFGIYVHQTTIFRGVII
jgi:hypothetical protein